MRVVAPSPPPTVFGLEGFVTYPKWSAVGPAVERRLAEEPNGTVVLDCGRVTGFVPGAFFALTNLIQSSAGRVQLRNWPAAVARAVVPQLLAAQLVGGLVSTVAARARQIGPAAPRAELDESVARLTACLAELQQNWFGNTPARPDLNAS